MKTVCICMLLSLAAALASCATIVVSPRQNVSVIGSEAKAARLTTTSGTFRIYSANQVVSLSRSRHNVTATIDCDGSGYTQSFTLYTQPNLWFLLGNLFSWNIIGWLVDGLGDAGWDYDSSINLQPYCHHLPGQNESQRPSIKPSLPKTPKKEFSYQDKSIVKIAKKLKPKTCSTKPSQHRPSQLWKVQYEKDKFDDNTDKQYLLSLLYGSYNSKTLLRNEKLSVGLVVQSSNHISLTIAEGFYYNREGKQQVDIKVAGVETSLSGHNRTDKFISLDEMSSTALHQYLLSNHEIKFYMQTSSSVSDTTYRFSLKSCHGYRKFFQKAKSSM